LRRSRSDANVLGLLGGRTVLRAGEISDFVWWASEDGAAGLGQRQWLLDANCRWRHGQAVRTVVLLRHGKSSWSDSTLADINRPLAPRGERASRKLAKYIRQKRIQPTLVLCSPSLRTRQTLKAVEASLGKRCAVEVVPQLYGASEQELLEQLQALPESVSSVMLIGHNPGLHNLALVLASRGADLPQLEEKFPTGALATLLIRSEGWAALGPGAAELVDYVVPKQLR
jgi:phosphohistidine phosphatase